MAYGSTPAIGGIVFPRPTSIDESPELRAVDVELAAGRVARYDGGRRFVVSLSWGNLTEAQIASLRAALAPPVVAYVHVDGSAYVMLSDVPKVTPRAGTDPVRFSAEVSLREQTVRY